MQIAFLTLFLGLVSGPLTVSLSVSPKVAAVELLLDGAAVDRLVKEPWTGNVDFGPGLLPHHLVARALDAKGSEVASAEQWINLPRPPAEVELAPEGSAAGEPRRVRVTWQSLTNEPPTSVIVMLDGKPLPLDAQYRVSLPPLPPNHPTSVLAAELRFPGNRVVRRDVAIGRDYSDAVASELTPVAVWLRPGRRLPPAAGMQGWFAEGGRPLQVDAVESGPAQLLVVRDPLARRLMPAVGSLPLMDDLAPGVEMSFVAARGNFFSGPVISSHLFDGSNRFRVTSSRQAASLLATVINSKERPGEPQELADAVAVAGVQAYATGRPSAVLAVLAPNGKDISRSDPAAVRRYLAAIHVPLLVWSAGTPARPAVAVWGRIEDCATWIGLRRGFGALKQVLDAQHVVWVEGRHLPQAITLSPPAADVLDLDPPS